VRGCSRDGLVPLMASSRRLFLRSRRTSRLRGSSAGFTAIELLLACVIGSLALAAAWSWLYSSAAAGGREQRRLEAETSLAFVERLTAAELRRAALFLASPAPGCSDHSVAFVLVGDDGATDTVDYVWNSATRVLWRKASGSHLVSGVTSFTVSYFDAAGAELAPAGGALSPAELARVHSLRLSVTLSWGVDRVTASWDVTPRADR
jgi:Tfp pilus assembly protein PilW